MKRGAGEVSPTSTPTVWWRTLSRSTCSLTSLLGMTASGAQALRRTPVRVSFMSFLLWAMYSSSSCPLMDAMLGSLNLQTMVKAEQQ